MTLYSSEMCSKANTGSYYVEVREVETDELVFTGRGCASPAGARRAAMNALALMFNAALYLRVSPACSAGQRVS